MDTAPVTAEPQIHDAWRNGRPRLRGDLVFRPHRVGGRTIMVIEDPARSKFFRLGMREYAFVAELDGSVTGGEALDRANSFCSDQGNGAGEGLSELDALSILHWAQQNQLLDQGPGAVVREEPAERPRVWNPLIIRIPLVDSEPWVARIYPYASWFYAPWATIAGVLLVLVAGAGLLERWDEFVPAMHSVFSPAGRVSLLVCWVVLKVLHELSHGLACKKYGGTPRAAGVVLLLFVPIAFVDVTSSWRIRSKWQRVHIALAGMQMEIVVAALAAIGWGLTPPGVLNQTLANIVLMASATTVLFNANPLMRYDGYYVLADVLERPNLYTDSQRWLRGTLRRLFFGPDRAAGGAALGDTVRVYAVLTLFWRLTVCVGLVLGAAVMWKGAGVLLAVVGAAIWFGLPTLRFARSVWQGAVQGRAEVRRFAVVSVLFVAGGALVLTFVPWPGATTAPAIVHYDPPAVVRAEADGFVEEVYVTDGQTVEAGEPLVRLRNRQLRVDVARLEGELAASKLRARGLRHRQKLAELEAELQEAASIEKKLTELREQLDSLVVRAPVSGRVVSRSVGNLLGTHKQRGEELLEVGNEDSKLVHFYIAQDALPDFQGGLGGPIDVALPAGTRFRCRLDRIDPRGTTVPAEPALCTPCGGSIVVRQNDEREPQGGNKPEHRLLKPHFTGTAELTAEQARDVLAGQRGIVSLVGSQQTLGEHLYGLVRGWLRSRLDRQG